MINGKKTVRNATFILMICILIITFFEVAPIIERKYSARFFIVTFDTGTGKNFDLLVDENKSVLKPAAPDREGYKFVGWYYGNSEYNFDSHVVKDITIRAIWEKEDETIEEEPKKPEVVPDNGMVTVKFDVVGGSLIFDQVIKKGGTATIPTAPTREGYTFVEWQLNGKTYDFGTVLYEDTTIVALWKENV